MHENFFEEFVEWIEEMSYDEITQSEEYKQINKRNGRICNKIIEGLGGDETLVEKYNESYAEMSVYYYYFLCRKVALAVVKIIADIGAV